MEHLQMLWRYARYLLKCKSKKNIHSPYVFQFITEVLEDDRQFYAYGEIERLRYALLQNNETIEVTDFGAGSTINASKKRKIKDLAKNSAKAHKYGQLLFRIVNHFQPKNMLELGTSLGISTLYQALAAPHSKFITMEGCPQTAKVAGNNFAKFNLKNTEIAEGNFDFTLENTLKKFSTLDYVFFDGNHQQEPTTRYFEQCLSLVNNDTIFIFDDIHWSGGMEAAWSFIQQHPKVSLTIDLFFIGLVFFRKESVKQDFTIIF